MLSLGALALLVAFVPGCANSSEETVTIKDTPFVLEIAADQASIELGLMHRETIPDGTGMIFIFPDVKVRSFFMKNCLSDIDINRRNIDWRNLDRGDIDRWVDAALAEDIGAGDITSRLCVSEARSARARIVCREPGVLAGLSLAKACFQKLDPDVSFPTERADGEEVVPEDVVLEIAGRGRALLGAERTALNFLQRLSGIATCTHQFVTAVAGTGARIMDTRKTTPLLRELERHAVRMGGGVSHRRGLDDQVLLKENHVALAEGSYEETVQAAVAGAEGPVIAEARDLAEALAAVRGGAAVVMLDNLAPGSGLAEVAAAVRRLAADLGRTVEMEASGGVKLDNVRAHAEAGVDRISVGGLTHSAPALDFSMLMSPAARPQSTPESQNP